MFRNQSRCAQDLRTVVHGLGLRNGSAPVAVWACVRASAVHLAAQKLALVHAAIWVCLRVRAVERHAPGRA